MFDEFVVLGTNQSIYVHEPEFVVLDWKYPIIKLYRHRIVNRGLLVNTQTKFCTELMHCERINTLNINELLLLKTPAKFNTRTAMILDTSCTIKNENGFRIHGVEKPSLFISSKSIELLFYRVGKAEIHVYQSPRNYSEIIITVAMDGVSDYLTIQKNAVTIEKLKLKMFENIPDNLFYDLAKATVESIVIDWN